MAGKIYYGIGFLVLLFYSISTIAPSLRAKPPVSAISFGTKRLEKGKYVPPAPSRSDSGGYDSGGGSGGGSRRSTSSFPTGGGYSGGK